MRKQKITIFILLIVQVLVLIGVFSYAWFANDFDPVIYSDQLQIASSEGLYIQLENEGAHVGHENEIYQEINLKNIANKVTSFSSLSQVSSADGVNIFTRTEEDGIISYTLDDKKENYIEISIMLVNADTGAGYREVYIEDLYLKLIQTSKNSENQTIETIQENDTSMVRDALRMSLEVSEIGSSTPIFLKIIGFNKDNNNLDNALTTEELNRYDDFKENNGNTWTDLSLMTGDKAGKGYNTLKAIYRAGISNETPAEVQTYAVNNGIVPNASAFINCIQNQEVYYLSCFKKYNGTGSSKVVNPNYKYPICNIPNSSNLKFTFRLWLEGADPRCDIPITGTTLQMKLVFGSTPNNG